MENAKQEVLRSEGDAYFLRNTEQTGKIKLSHGAYLLDEFLANNRDFAKRGNRILEVGCCYGYNLAYLCEKHGMMGCGVEPSQKAVEHGNSLYKDKEITLLVGTADSLPYEDSSFEIVMLGFCLFWVDRKFLLRAVAEADRVLCTGGLLAVWDFDTALPYRRINTHNEQVPTYKQNIGAMFTANPQYYLIEKRSFSHQGKCFHKDIQERLALEVFYKEDIENSYVFAK